MKRLSTLLKLLTAVTFCLIAVSFSISTAWGGQSDPLAGKWKMSSSSPEGDQIDWTLTITYADGKYSAVAATGEETPVKDLKVDGNKIHFRVSYQGEEYDIDVTRDGNSLKGTWSGNGQSGDTKGEKASGA